MMKELQTAKSSYSHEDDLVEEETPLTEEQQELKEIKMSTREYTGANWNDEEDNYTQTFFDQNTSQFWLPEEIAMQQDLNLWSNLSEEVKDAYVKNLVVLTFLDTYQGEIGMPVVSRALPEEFHQRKTLLNFQAMMEGIHAKSYSNIFMTYLPNEEIKEAFQWGQDNPHMQKILSFIVGAYEHLDELTYLKRYADDKPSKQDFDVALWKAMVASVYLETCLFYSGFYYPLYFYGQGKLMGAGEIINLIIRDESIHGVYIGMLAMEIYETFDKDTQDTLHEWAVDLIEDVYEAETKLIEEIYDQVELTHDVKIFVRYNANKAMMNLGFDTVFEEEEVNPVIINGLKTESKQHDFFSQKGNSYQKATSEALKDDDFDFSDLDRGF